MLSLMAMITGPADALDDDELLMQVARQRDAQALEVLYDRHSGLVFSLLVRMTGQPASAEELCQDVFFKLWRRADAFDGQRGALRPWLLTLARNTALDRLRSKAEKQRGGEIGSDDPVVPVAPAGLDAWLDIRRQAAAATRLMADLPERQRQALELAYFEGCSQSEIARRLDAPLGTVKTWVRKALLALRIAMQESQGGAT